MESKLSRRLANIVMFKQTIILSEIKKNILEHCRYADDSLL